MAFVVGLRYSVLSVLVVTGLVMREARKRVLK